MNPDHIETPALAGLRPLTLEERKQRSESRACIDPDKRPGTSICSQSLWISLFFDGTGNNRFIDTEKSKHSNVARLYLAHDAENDSTCRYPIYVPGLGTPFPEIGELTADTFGLAFGSGGDKRLAWARKKFDEVITQAKARANNPKHRIRMINVSLFGFSRGATLARAFAHRLAQECQQQGGQWTYQGYPIRLYFMGLFDTVASVGFLSAGTKVVERDPLVAGVAIAAAGLMLAATPWSLALVGKFVLDPKDGHKAWAGSLKIPAMVEQCLHYVAAHEVRDSFPLDSVRDGERYPDNCKEVMYPGVHSDVGGGYAPGEQTRTLVDNEKLSQVPLLDMYRAARVAGVPLRWLDNLDADTRAAFDLSPKTEALYEDYQRGALKDIPLEIAVAQHLYRLYLARTPLAWDNDSQAWLRLPETEQVLTQTGNSDIVAEQKEQLKAITQGGLAINRAGDEAAIKKRNGRTLTLSEEMLARAHEETSFKLDAYGDRETLLTFFDYCVHDSVAGFSADFSKLQSWRIMYFGEHAHEPSKVRSVPEGLPGEDLTGDEG